MQSVYWDSLFSDLFACGIVVEHTISRCGFMFQMLHLRLHTFAVSLSAAVNTNWMLLDAMCVITWSKQRAMDSQPWPLNPRVLSLVCIITVNYLLTQDTHKVSF